MDNPSKFTAIEWCAGYGGIHLGLKRAIPNLRVIAYGEIEAFAAANLVAKMEAGLLDPAPLWTDIKTFPCEEFRDRVGLLVAGYPCQPFSAAGKRLGAEDPRHLWPHIARAIGIIRPRLCFFENVEGHISLGLREVIGELGAIGYTAAWGIFSASVDAGAPHQRKRVFILAYDQRERVEELGRQIAVGSQQHSAWDDGDNAWPSRPGEPQHAWEPPRVVGNASQRNVSREQGCRVDTRTKADAQRATNNDITDGPSADCAESMGNANSPRPQERTGQRGAGIQGTHADGGADASGEIKSSVGDPVDGTQLGVGIAELSGLSHQELAEICEWMVKCESRTDELRLLGNGVVPATAERAFRTLWEELSK